MIDSQRIWGRNLLLGIAKYVRLHGPWLLLNEPGRQKKTALQIRRLAPDGIIMNEQPYVSEIAELDIPVIVALDTTEQISNCCLFDINNSLVGNMAAEYLISLRFRNFAFCGFTDRFWSRERKASFIDVVEQAGFEIAVYDRHSAKFLSTATSERERLKRWLLSLPKPVGIMACVDDCGKRILDACRLAKIRVPDEVAVIGVDNDELVCDISYPSLTSIELNFQAGGYDAARLLEQLMNHQEVSSDLVTIQPTRIVERRSTETLAIEDAGVSEAIRYIRHNYRHDLPVDMIADSVMLSRRVLERRFRKYLGRSVLEEINNVRISHAIELLLETRLSIEKIALAVGYTSLKHFSRTFRKVKGITARQFRQQFSLT